MARRKAPTTKREAIEAEWRRAANASAAAHREFEAAKRTRRTFYWSPTSFNGNEELIKALPMLQKRHQDLVSNSAWGRRAIDAIVGNWIGAGIRGVVPRDVPAAKRRAWVRWSETTRCDYWGMENLYGLQELWARQVSTRGGVLIRRMPRPDGEFPISLQTIDVADLYAGWRVELKRDEQVVGGMVVNSEGQVLRYLVRDPGRVRQGLIVKEPQPLQIPADEVIHLYRTEFPGQLIGIPWGVAAMLRARDLDDYESTELLKQKLAACYAAFRVTLDPEADGPDEDDGVETIEPGTVKRLPMGEDVRFAQPPTVGSYDVFLRHNLRALAMAWGITYETLTGNLSEVNYSSARMGYLQLKKNVAAWRRMMKVRALQRIEGWLDQNSGQLGRGSGLQLKWIEPRAEIFDPQKEVAADRETVRAGFSSLRDMQASYGHEPEELMDELEEDLKGARDRDLVLTTDVMATVEAGQPEDMGADPVPGTDN